MRKALLMGLVLACGFGVGWVCARGAARGRAADRGAEPVAEISVSRPDPSEPTGFSGTRLHVTRAGDNAAGPGVQGRDEWSVVLWYGTAEDTPRRSRTYYAAPR